MEEENEFRHPEPEDCFEYKLVGVNIHTGSAQGGHYFSYINTNRENDTVGSDPAWMQTENDPWMEFNDSRVSNFKFENLEEDAFGEKSKSYSSIWGGDYGKSAYMLIYERR